MTYQNLNRCIKTNKIQASDLEKIAKALDIPVSYFFEETGGDVPVASAKGSGGCEHYIKEIEYLKQQIIDKEKIISLLEQ